MNIRSKIFILLLFSALIGILTGVISYLQPKQYSVSLVPQKYSEISLIDQGQDVTLPDNPGQLSSKDDLTSTPEVKKSIETLESDKGTRLASALDSNTNVNAKPSDLTPTPDIGPGIPVTGGNPPTSTPDIGPGIPVTGGNPPTSTPDIESGIPVTGGSLPTATPEIEPRIPKVNKNLQCPGVVFFDAKGNPYYYGDKENLANSIKKLRDYPGPAPMYRIEPYSSNICNDENELSIGSMNSSLVTNGEPYYSFLIFATTPTRFFYSGESFLLTVDISIDQYINPIIPISTGNPSEQSNVVTNGVFLGHIDPDQIMKVNFSMKCTNFDYASADQNNSLGITTPLSHSWIISPHKDVIGNQVLVIEIDFGEYKRNLKVPLIVEEKNPSSPITDGGISAIGVLILSFLTFIRTYKEQHLIIETNVGKPGQNSSKKR